jgi:hypothetical protein
VSRTQFCVVYGSLYDQRERAERDAISGRDQSVAGPTKGASPPCATPLVAKQTLWAGRFRARCCFRVIPALLLVAQRRSAPADTSDARRSSSAGASLLPGDARFMGVSAL